MVERTDERIEELAQEVVDQMDMKTMVAFVFEQLLMHYEENLESFEEDWEIYRGEDEDAGPDPLQTPS